MNKEYKKLKDTYIPTIPHSEKLSEKEKQSSLELSKKEYDEKLKNLQNLNDGLISKIKNLEKENEKLNKKAAKLALDKKNNKSSEKEIFKSTKNFGVNDIFISDIFNAPSPSKNDPNFNEFPGMNLKGSIIPAKLGQIKEEGENDEENDNFELGGDYMEPDEEKDDDKIQKEKMKKEQEKKFKQSRLKFSINSNDENYLNDLKNEINGLYKLRDNLNDQITKDEQKIQSQEEQLEKLNTENQELKKIIEKKNEEIEQLNINCKN